MGGLGIGFTGQYTTPCVCVCMWMCLQLNSIQRVRDGEIRSRLMIGCRLNDRDIIYD